MCMCVHMYSIMFGYHLYLYVYMYVGSYHAWSWRKMFEKFVSEEFWIPFHCCIIFLILCGWESNKECYVFLCWWVDKKYNLFYFEKLWNCGICSTHCNSLPKLLCNGCLLVASVKLDFMYTLLFIGSSVVRSVWWEQFKELFVQVWGQWWSEEMWGSVNNWASASTR